MDYRNMAQRLMGSSYPKNVLGPGDYADAIKKGMQPKPKPTPGADYPKKVKVTT